MIRRVPDLAPQLLPARGLRWERFAFPGRSVAVASEDREALSLFRSLYRAFLFRRGEAGAGREVRLFLLRRGKEYLAIDPGFPSFICADPHRAVSFLSAQLFVNHLFRSSLLFLHGSVVLREGRALIFCGGSGSGKSTLAVKLERAGHLLLSDEFAPLDLRTGLFRAFPRSFLIRGRRRGLVFLDWEERDRRGRPSRRALSARPPSSRDLSAPPGAVFLLQGFRRGRTELRPLPAARALGLLLDHAVNPGYLRAGKGTGPIRGLTRLLSAVPAWSVRLGGGRESPAELAAAVARAAASPPRGRADLKRVAARCAELLRDRGGGKGSSSIPGG